MQQGKLFQYRTKTETFLKSIVSNYFIAMKQKYTNKIDVGCVCPKLIFINLNTTWINNHSFCIIVIIVHLLQAAVKKNQPQQQQSISNTHFSVVVALFALALTFHI